MLVREFTLDDKQTFMKLCEEFYDSHATLRPYNAEIAAKTFERVTAKHENLWGFLMLSYSTGEPVGYSLITSYWCNEEGGNVLVLDELYIDTSDRHQGYATKFMDWLQEYYQGKAVAITLEVLTSNQKACALYAKEGFEPDGFVTFTKKLN